jgi:alpha-1,4-galacturonosyltransferase
MAEVLVQAQEKNYDTATMVKKLRAMLQSAEENARMLKKQSTFLSQLAAKTIPKGLHCFSMSLTVEYHMLPLNQRDFPHQEKLEDPSLYHYALFSDNILATGVVVNSAISNAKVCSHGTSLSP